MLVRNKMSDVYMSGAQDISNISIDMKKTGRLKDLTRGLCLPMSDLRHDHENCSSLSNYCHAAASTAANAM